jgi:hypothetical protein
MTLNAGDRTPLLHRFAEEKTPARATPPDAELVMTINTGGRTPLLHRFAEEKTPARATPPDAELVMTLNPGGRTPLLHRFAGEKALAWALPLATLPDTVRSQRLRPSRLWRVCSRARRGFGHRDASRSLAPRQWSGRSRRPVVLSGGRDHQPCEHRAGHICAGLDQVQGGGRRCLGACGSAAIGVHGRPFDEALVAAPLHRCARDADVEEPARDELRAPSAPLANARPRVLAVLSRRFTNRGWVLACLCRCEPVAVVVVRHGGVCGSLRVVGGPARGSGSRAGGPRPGAVEAFRSARWSGGGGSGLHADAEVGTGVVPSLGSVANPLSTHALYGDAATDLGHGASQQGGRGGLDVVTSASRFPRRRARMWCRAACGGSERGSPGVGLTLTDASLDMRETVQPAPAQDDRLGQARPTRPSRDSLRSLLEPTTCATQPRDPAGDRSRGPVRDGCRRPVASQPTSCALFLYLSAPISAPRSLVGTAHGAGQGRVTPTREQSVGGDRAVRAADAARAGLASSPVRPALEHGATVGRQPTIANALPGQRSGADRSEAPDPRETTIGGDLAGSALASLLSARGA